MIQELFGQTLRRSVDLMSIGGWLHKFAFGGCVTALLLLPMLASAKEGNTLQKAQTQKTDKGQQTPAPQLPLAPVNGEGPVDTDWKKVECTKPKSHDEADLCEQRRMSQAAENSVWLSKVQILLGVIGAILVLWSLFYTRVAAIAARDAANSSLESALTASKQTDAMIRAERPYVFLEITEPGVDIGADGAYQFMLKRLCFSFVNYGRTPALLTEFKEAYPIVDDHINPPAPIDPMKDRGRMLPTGTVSVPEKPYNLKTNLMLQSEANNKFLQPHAWAGRRLFFQGFIRYSDTFGNHYITGFLSVFSPAHSAWVLRGDEQYNYSRQERQEDVPQHPDYVERPDPDSKSE